MDELQARFSQILQTELGQLARLELVLGQEFDALKQQNNDALSENLEEKQKLIHEIESLGRQRLELLRGAGQGDDKVAVLAFVSAEAELNTRWQELEATLLRCQKQNQVNGMLLEKGKMQAQQLLGVLLGKESGSDGATYDAKGATSSSFSNGRSVKV